MKNRQYIKYFLVVSLLLIAFLPVTNFYKYAKNYDFKQSFNTDSFESRINYIVYKLFNISFEEKVVTGKDKFLFLGNPDAQIVHKTLGIFRPSQKELSNWLTKLKDVQNYYKEINIPFVIAMAPDKNSIYKEKLPNWMSYDGETITDDIVKVARELDINLLDLRPALLDAKGEELLYWKTDSHWNAKGAEVAYTNTIDYINKIHKQEIQKAKYKLIPKTRPSGDIARLLKLDNILSQEYEIDYIYDFQNNHDICIGYINKETFELEECENKPNQVLDTYTYPMYIKNPNPQNELKLLYICDSFSAAPSPFYSATFSQVFQLHWRHLKGDDIASFIKEYKPDIVIYQLVERAFITFPEIVTPISKK